ncbi:MAG: T9SS type A sorting domain-containing protein, partial [Ignavibacteria bacterium]|nr:T9SS type A sorting domain-containing protein [Ignavibacteria bacterium]
PPYVKRSVTSTIATNLDSSVVLSYDRVMQRLYIVADMQDVEYTIVSIEGRPLSKGIFNDTIDISTAGWQPGVYIAVFYAGDRVVVRKVVV